LCARKKSKQDKNFSEKLIAYFPFIPHGPYRRPLTMSLLFRVYTLTRLGFLPNHCSETIKVHA
jgi:hypothetical protein